MPSIGDKNNNLIAGLRDTKRHLDNNYIGEIVLDYGNDANSNHITSEPETLNEVLSNDKLVKVD